MELTVRIISPEYGKIDMKNLSPWIEYRVRFKIPITTPEEEKNFRSIATRDKNASS